MTDHARVILLTGPSGAGKSRLAARTGLPVLRLDDFYKEAGDTGLPSLPSGSGVDWDHPASWNARSAVAAIRALCLEGRTVVPEYSLSASAVTGERTMTLDRAPLFVAEGIFAAEIGAACAAEGLLADSLCLRNHPLTTFRRRLLRDLRESRKPWPVLVRRGWSLLRAERSIVARRAALGAVPCRRDEALRRVARCGATARVVAPRPEPAPRDTASPVAPVAAHPPREAG